MRFGLSITAGQLRAARGLIGWSQEELARKAKIGRATIADFESGKRMPYQGTLHDLRGALEAAGVEFTNGGQPGVRMKATLTDFGDEPRTEHKSDNMYFKLKDGNKEVRVGVSQPGLEDRQGEQGSADMLAIFERQRPKIVATAQIKYRNGYIEKDGSILIKNSDLE
jgi:transcriptional regulator with XRE-family HTH domain